VVATENNTTERDTRLPMRMLKSPICGKDGATHGPLAPIRSDRANRENLTPTRAVFLRKASQLRR
jgi:hypothetical protein